MCDSKSIAPRATLPAANVHNHRVTAGTYLPASDATRRMLVCTWFSVAIIPEIPARSV